MHPRKQSRIIYLGLRIDLIETRKETARGMTETPRGTGHTNTTEELRTGERELDDDVVGSQQKNSPEEGIPEGGPIPLHRDTTICCSSCYNNHDFRPW